MQTNVQIFSMVHIDCFGMVYTTPSHFFLKQHPHWIFMYNNRLCWISTIKISNKIDYNRLTMDDNPEIFKININAL